MSTEWKINSKIYLVICDSRPNIVKSVKDLHLQSALCFLHKLNLIVTDALNSQRAIKDIIGIGSKIITHFNQSSSACSHFKRNLRTIAVFEV